MAIASVTVHGEILEADLTPAVGTVTFRILQELRDTVDNITLVPTDFVATLDLNGEFSIVVPTTDNPDITPLDWSYQIYVSTSSYRQTYYVQIPAALGPVVEFADLIPLDDPETCTPDGTACAPISIVGEVSALETLVAGLDGTVDALIITVGDIASDVSTLQGDLGVLDTTVGALVGQVNTISPIVLANQAAITVLQGQITNINAAWITSGTLDYRRLGGVVAENLSVVFGRATLVTPGTAADVWQWQYNGQRVIYINKYACLRARGIPDNQVPARFMSHNTRDGTTLATFQVGLSDATTMLFQVLANGDILAPGGLSMLPTAPVAVTFTAPAASAATISDGASSGAPYSLTTTLHAAANRVYLDGAVSNPSGGAIAGGTVLFTITAAHRPTAWVQFNERTSTTLSARVTIRPDGTVRLDQPLAAGATCSFDGLNWRKA